VRVSAIDQTRPKLAFSGFSRAIRLQATFKVKETWRKSFVID
jgi:hypothetical protein